MFTNPENYETLTLKADLVGDAKDYLVENATVTVTFVEEKAVSIELPSSVILTVTDAPEGIRGDSANNVQKAAPAPGPADVAPPADAKPPRKPGDNEPESATPPPEAGHPGAGGKAGGAAK